MDKGPKIFGLPSSMNHKIRKTQTKRKTDPVYENGYFDSYSHFGIHEEMLKDSVRTESYQKALIQNKDTIKDKIVLDIGCGTGILSLFAARAGAKHVYAIEMADIAKFAKRIVKENNYDDKITIIQGKVEEVALPVQKVDIIISEWMGYFLLFESMLDSVLFARDKWLAKDGLILPNKTSLFICGIEDFEFKKDKVHFWEDVYGFNMSCVKEETLKEPLVDYVEPNTVVTNSANILTLDLYKTKTSNLIFEKPFKLKARKNNYLHAFVCYFDVSFDSLPNKVWFSTGPFHETTHWKQTVFYTDEDLMLKKDTNIKGRIEVRRNPQNHRETDIFISSEYGGNKTGISSIKQKRWYFLR